MRIVTYNILDGGEGRADPLAEVIEAQRPDLVSLVEADDLSVLERIAKRLNMDFVQAVGKNNKASALLSRFRIRDSINHGATHREITKSLLEATVVTPEFGDLPVGVVHLSAGAYESDEKTREQELVAVLDCFKRHRDAGRPHLLAGDFNANSPVQQIDPARTKPKTQKAWQSNGGNVPRRVVQHLLDAGYADTLQSHDPRAAATLTTFSTKDPGQRVDYVFSFNIPPSRVQRAWVELDRLATYASDHYPYCVELA